MIPLPAGRLMLFLSCFVFPSFALAQTSYPMITHTQPVAVQRGKISEITIEGQMNFYGVHKLLIEGKGIVGEILPSSTAGTKPNSSSDSTKSTPPPIVRSAKLRLSVDASAPLGVREFRLASSLGISTLGQLLVVDDPVLLETANNNTPAQAMPIPVSCVVSARIEAAEDVDCFKVPLKAGQTITLEVICARIQDKIHDLQKHADPLLIILDETGREIVSNDDGAFADPLLTFTAPANGNYIIQVRDAKFDGDPRWVYALIVTDKPYASQVFPMAGNPGQSVTVTPVGSAAKTDAKITFTVPQELGIHSLALPLAPGRGTTNPVAFIVSDLPMVEEKESNDTIANAQRISLPIGIHGRIQKKRDIDHFIFRANKGQTLRLEVFARRFGTELRSGLDSLLEILSPQGALLASNDDTNGKDAAITFTPPADGDYVIRLRDLHSKGGDDFVYFLAIAPALPDFTVKCDPSKIMIGPGTSHPCFVQVNRLHGFAGPVCIEVKGLPQGIRVNPLIIPENMTQGVLVFTVDADAPVDAAMIDILASGNVIRDGRPVTITRRAIPIEEIYLPGGGRGRFDVRMQALAVTKPSDILRVEVTPDRIVAKPGDEVKLAVKIVRRPDYDKSVTIDVLLRHLGQVFANPLPPGVTMLEGKSKTLLGTGNDGHIVLKIAPDAAPVDEVPLCVMANVSINFVVKVSYSSLPLRLTIRK